MTNVRNSQSVFDPSSFDQAAGMAEAELLAYVSRADPACSLAVKDLAAWWEKWFMVAGHKRLGRILVKLARKQADA